MFRPIGRRLLVVPLEHGIMYILYVSDRQEFSQARVPVAGGSLRDCAFLHRPELRGRSSFLPSDASDYPRSTSGKRGAQSRNDPISVLAGDMLDGPGEFKTEWTRHGAGVYPSPCRIARLDPISVFVFSS